MEGSDHVFIAVKIHSRLAADAAVHLGQKRRRELDESDAPQIGGRREACQIADDAPSQGRQHILTVKMLQNQVLIQSPHGIQRLVLLARLHRPDRHFPKDLRKLFPDCLRIKRARVAVRDDTEPSPPHAQRLHTFRQPFKILLQPYLITELSVPVDRKAPSFFSHMNLSFPSASSFLPPWPRRRRGCGAAPPATCAPPCRRCGGR